MNILFVCTGNTCRSPMAMGYLKNKMPFLNVESRGLAADGSPVSENSRLALLDIGIDISAHISAQIKAEDIEKADKIICMSPNHKAALLSVGVESEKLFLLGDGIIDPFGGNLDIYRATRDNIIAEIDRLISVGFFGEAFISPLNPENTKDIAELEKVCFSTPWSENVIKESYENGTLFFTAFYNNRFAGYVGINTVLDEGYITNIAVLPEYRNKGIATKLLKTLFYLAENKALSFISLEVRKSNTSAISLYEKFGFKTEGLRKNFYREPTEDALILTKRF